MNGLGLIDHDIAMELVQDLEFNSNNYSAEATDMPRKESVAVASIELPNPPPTYQCSSTPAQQRQNIMTKTCME